MKLPSLRIEAIIAALNTEPSPDHLSAVTDAIEKCIAAVNDGEGSVDESLEHLAKLTDREWQAETFFEIWGWTSAAELAETASRILPAPIFDLTAEELDALLNLMPVYPNQHYLDFLQASLPNNFTGETLPYPCEEVLNLSVACELVRRREILETSGLVGLKEYELGIAQQVLETSDLKRWQTEWARMRLRRERWRKRNT